MGYPVEIILTGVSVLLLLSIFASKAASKLRVPALLIFIFVGMLAGSEGPGGIEFDDAGLAQFLGVIALALIIFSGGLHSSWNKVAPVIWKGVFLSTAGVFITAVLVGLFAHSLLGFSPLTAFLLGAIVSSTDAAAVFSVIGASGTRLKSEIEDLLEFESGSNDPMAVILTIGFIHLVIDPSSSYWSMAYLLVSQMLIGVVAGVLMGKAMVFLINRLKLDYDGLYPVLSLTLVVFTYGCTTSIGGSGFLAVYIAGLIMGGSDFVHKRSLTRFHDGLAWLMQITMFLILGLLVFPSQLLPVVFSGLLVSLFLIFVARPLSVFVSLQFSNYTYREKSFISWVGLRGAVPIILATFPLLAGIPESEMLFNIVFFIVITSVLLQGATIPFASRKLGVEALEESTREKHLEFKLRYDEQSEQVAYDISPGSGAVGKQVVELALPDSVLIMLVERGDTAFMPRGDTIIQSGDRLIVFADKSDLLSMRSILGIAEQKISEPIE